MYLRKCRVIEALEPRHLLSSAMLADLNPVTYGSTPNGMTQAGSTVYFFADDGITGQELWAYDGVSGYPKFLGDVYRGAAGSTAFGAPMAALGDSVYYFANDGVHGSELWTANTAFGPRLITDLRSGSLGSNGNSLTRVGNRLYFTADTGGGAQLFFTDGQTIGAVNPPGSSPSNLTAVGSKLFYSANVSGARQLFVIGQADAQPVQLTFTSGFGPQSGFARMVDYNGVAVYVSENGGLWSSDGTAFNTTLIQQLPTATLYSGLSVANNLVWFAPGVGSPWRSDGTNVGTFEVVFSGTVKAAMKFTEYRGLTFFTGESTGFGRELWVTGGTQFDTWQLSDIQAGTADGVSYFATLKVYDDKLWIYGDIGMDAIYRVDGSDISTPTVYANYVVSDSIEFNGSLLLSAANSIPNSGDLHGQELYTATNYTPPTLVADLNWNTQDSTGLVGATLGTNFIFSGGAGTTGVSPEGIYKTNANGQISLVRAFSGGVSSSVMTAFNGFVYFWAQGTGAQPYSLWRTDGTSNGTTEVASLPALATSAVVVGNTLYFITSTGAALLWKTDGTTNGTKQITFAEQFPPQVYNITAYGTTALIGTDRGMYAVTQGSTTPFWFFNSNTQTVVNQISATPGTKLYFQSGSGSDNDIYVTDGTAAGTFAVTPAGASVFNNPVMLGTKAYFIRLASGQTPDQLWESDGTVNGTKKVAAVNNATNNPLFAWNNYLYYFGANRTLWRTNGTAVEQIGASTVQVSPSPSFFATPEVLYFRATDQSHGEELWRTDGTTAGTWMVDDLASTIASSAPTVRGAIGNVIFFSAKHTYYGMEMFTTAPPPRPVPGSSNYTVVEGSGVQLSLVIPAGTQPVQAADWDLNYTGIFNTDSQGSSSVFFNAANIDGPTVRTVMVRAYGLGGTTELTFNVTITNKAPTAAFAASTPTVTLGQAASVGFTSPSDVTADMAGLRYSYDFNNDGDFVDAGDVANSTLATASFTFASAGTKTVRGRISDKDGGFTDYTTTVTVNAAQASSPVAWYKFDESSGTAAADSSGNGFNVTLGGGLGFVAGKTGNALNFTTTGQYATAASAAALNATSAITLSAWVNATDWSGNRRIIQKGLSDNQYRLLAENGVLKFDLKNVGSITAALPSVAAWHLVTGTYDGATMRLYVDGVQVVSAAKTGAIATTADALFIGAKRSGDTTAGNHFKGKLDDVRIYNKALTAAEVQALAGSVPPADTQVPSTPGTPTLVNKTDKTVSITWTASTDNVGVTRYDIFRNNVKVGTSTTASFADSGLTASTAYAYKVQAFDAAGNASAQSAVLNVTTNAASATSPVAWYKFDETSGTSAADASGNGIGATVNGATFTTGKTGNALTFTGNQQYATVANTAALNPTSAITISAWVNATNWSGNRRIVQKGLSDNQYRLLAENGVLKFDLKNVGSITATLPSTGVWHLITGTYDGAKMTLYVDGVVAATAAKTGAIAVTSDPLFIGAKKAGDTTAGNNFLGKIDDVRIYNKALTAGEVAALLNG